MKLSTSYLNNKNMHLTKQSRNQSFDMCENISLVPVFINSRVNLYFCAFECVPTAWLAKRHRVHSWPILFQCKLVVKAQEVVSSLWRTVCNMGWLKWPFLHASEQSRKPIDKKLGTTKSLMLKLLSNFHSKNGSTSNSMLPMGKHHARINWGSRTRQHVG